MTTAPKPTDRAVPMHAMYNRSLRNYDNAIEVSFYKAWRRLGVAWMSPEYAKQLPVQWVSPLEVYSATHGTMGLT